jgi:hypothetical protein
MDPELTREEIQLRKKQANCVHPSFRCSCCGLYKDNLHNKYVRTIRALLKIIDDYEKTLGVHQEFFIEEIYEVHH